MSSQVLVPRPHFDNTSALHQERSLLGTPESAIKDGLYPSSGLATAGYRCAKYSPEEWKANLYSALRQAESDHDDAQKIRHESKTLYMETEAQTLRSQSDGTRHLGQRLHDIHFWKSELQRHIEQIVTETELLLGLKRRLEKSLRVSESPFAIATDNLSCRERRPASDLVKDDVEVELLKEVDLIRNIQALLKRTLTQATDQIRTNREAKKTLEMDWSDKFEAYSMDDECGRYNNVCPDTQHHPNSAKFQDHTSNPESWTKFTQDNVALASRELQASMELRRLGERVLQETSEDLRRQCAVVDHAFALRCQEVAQAKVQLELHLSQTLEQIGAQERNIAALQKALYDKEAPLRVAQSRLYRRSHRPNVELCRDDPQLSLVAEVGEIERTIEALRQQLAESRLSLGHLEDTRMSLEKTIGCKTHSLLIDRDMCMAQRTRYPSVSALSGY